MIKKRNIVMIVICALSLILNLSYISKLKKESLENWKLKKTIEDQNLKIAEYEIKAKFLDDNVVIIPSETDWYISYDNWLKTKYYNQSFYLLKKQIAIDKGYKYYSSFVEKIIDN